MSISNLSPIDKLGRLLQRGSTRAKLLLLPVAVFETVFFVIPLLYLLRISLYKPSASGNYMGGTWSIQSYVNIFTSPFILDTLLFTIKFAVVSTVITVIIGFAYAYAIWRANGIKRTILLFAIVLPLVTTIVAKLYAWLLLLTPTGVINNLLLSTGLIDQPLPLMNNFLGALIGQVYMLLPYAVLAIFSVMSTLNWDTVEAAYDMGASRPRAVLEVVIPGSMPGIAVATVVTWAWGVGAYASPSLLGSASERTAAIAIEDKVLTQFNWPAGSALALLILVFVLISTVLLYNFLSGGDQSNV